MTSPNLKNFQQNKTELVFAWADLEYVDSTKMAKQTNWYYMVGGTKCVIDSSNPNKSKIFKLYVIV